MKTKKIIAKNKSAKAEASTESKKNLILDLVDQVAKTETSKAEKKDKTKKDTEAVAKQSVLVHRDLKYKYPKGMLDQIERKKFRQTVRNKIRAIERQISELKGQDKKDIQTELDAYKATVIA